MSVNYSRFGWLLFVGLLLGVVGCDHTTKHLALSELKNGADVSLVKNVLSLEYVTNTDTAFGVLGSVFSAETRRVLILILQGLTIVFLGGWLVRRFPVISNIERAAFALVLGGAVGNFSDRLLRGHVIDFIHLRHWPVFNVADIAVCIGAGLLFLASRKHPTRATS
ncbi:MAG TPA: signal peptidase II [Polyangiaceae bacterium]|nr:signal peptidase II [Polyangiaceae bacterium]